MATSKLLKQAMLPTSAKKSITVGIIGSAGRKEDARRMTKDIFYKMLNKAEEVITHQFGLDLSQVHLISGGAAWADHIAVMLFVKDKVGALTLHLPTRWHQDAEIPHYDDNKNGNIWKNPGRSANKLHKQFTDKLGESSLQHISSAIYIGALCRTHDGFMKRNSAVAQDSKYLIAFTWNEGERPKIKSGTHDTWLKHTGNHKVHIPIGSLIGGAQPPRLESIGESSKTINAESKIWPKHELVSQDSAYSSGSQSEGFLESCEQLQGQVMTDSSRFLCNDQTKHLKRERTSSCEIYNGTHAKKRK